MGFAEIPLPAASLDELAAHYPDIGAMLQGSSPERLHGGEESAAYRLGQLVVRIGARWRTAAETEWAYAVALSAAAQVPEALAPLASATGRTVLMIGDRPVSVWPYVAGSWAQRTNPSHFQTAARLLARLHIALAGAGIGPRPRCPRALGDVPDLADPELDEWLGRFDRTHQRQHPLHGDYFPGNLLAQGDQLVAVLDWDEAYIGTPESELAVAAWEWGDGLRIGNLDRARTFVSAYRQCGGPADVLNDIALRQLIRHRLRWEIRLKRGGTWETAPTANDDAYAAAQETAFRELAPGRA
jgi:Ser/Thr protein kinase RdoA (MazF antagonist)